MTEISNEYMKQTLENGVVISTYEDGVSVSLDCAVKCVEDRKRLTDYKVTPILVEGTQIKGIDKEARDYYSSKEGEELLSAAALLINSPFTSIIGNFLMKISFKKNRIPIKLFSNRNEALNWLEQYK